MLSTGCLSLHVGEPPPCPSWSDAAKGEAREAQKTRPALAHELGRWALYCEAIEDLR